MKNTLTFLPLVICFFLLLGYNFMSAQWSAPPQTPPNGNTPAPINLGPDTQAKSGNFMANIMAAATSTWSPRYCDEVGQNCVDGSDLVGGSSVRKYDSGWISSWTTTHRGVRVTHDLGVIPDLVVVEARFKVNDSPWVVGEIVELSTWGSDYDNYNENWGVSKTDTDIYVSTGVGIQGYNASIQPTNADIRVKAFVF